MSTSDLIFSARLLNLDVFEPNGQRVGRIRDVVVLTNLKNNAPAVTGFVIDTNHRKRAFMPVDKISDITNQQVIAENVENLKKFEQRGAEKLVAGELFDQEIIIIEDGTNATIEDIAFEKNKKGYLITQVFVRQGKTNSPLGRFRRGETKLVAWAQTLPAGTETPQAATQFIETHANENPADFAVALNEMSFKRRVEVAYQLADNRLADVLEEMNEDDQIKIIEALETERAAKILEAMEPDDAADLVGELSPRKADDLLQLMEPDDAAEMRRLLAYDDDVAGALMTPVPIILPPEATAAEALAHVQQEEISPANASTIFVCRPPLETPTGTYLGSVHFQRLLRNPPGEAIGSLLDHVTDPVSDQATISHVVRLLATYDLVALPVVNAQGALVGAITVDDVLDHLLPDDWRDAEQEHRHG